MSKQRGIISIYASFLSYFNVSQSFLEIRILTERTRSKQNMSKSSSQTKCCRSACQNLWSLGWCWNSFLAHLDLLKRIHDLLWAKIGMSDLGFRLIYHWKGITTLAAFFWSFPFCSCSPMHYSQEHASNRDLADDD